MILEYFVKDMGNNYRKVPGTGFPTEVFPRKMTPLTEEDVKNLLNCRYMDKLVKEQITLDAIFSKEDFCAMMADASFRDFWIGENGGKSKSLWACHKKAILTEVYSVNKTIKVSPKTPLVYFAQARTGGPIKIGHSNNGTDRVKQLQTGNAEEVVIVASLPGGRTLEAILHARFAEHRLHGEWFAPCEELLTLIRELNP